MINSFGKFNAIYTTIGSINRFKSLVEEVTREFKPEETVFSRFDLESKEMSFDFERTIIDNDSIIHKAILSRKEEEIIVEYCTGKVLVEHLFWYYPERCLTGMGMINKIIQDDEKDGVLITGFELSVDVNRVEESIEEVKTDKSTHPVIIINFGKTNKSISEYRSDNSIITEHKMQMIKSYIEYF